MKLKPLPLLLATLLGASSGALAADLLETFRAAQANDPVFAAARATMQAGQEKLPQGRSLLMPSISLSANSTLNDSTIQYRGATLLPGGGNNRYNGHGYGVNLTQPLFRQQNWLSYTEAELQVAQAEAQFRVTEQDLILRVAQAYFDVLIAQDSVEIKRRTLQQLINAMPQDLRHLGKEFKLEAPQPADMEKWVDDAQLNSLQLAIAQAGAKIAEKEVARNRGGHYPTVDLVANYSNSQSNGGSFGVGSDNTNKSVGVQLNLPLFQGGAVNSKWREAEANRERALQELENTRRSVALQTRQAYLGVVSGIAQVKALQQALVSSESVLEASKVGQEVGVRTNLDVLNAQQQLYSTRRALYQAEYSYLLSRLRLKAAVGSLGEEELNKINQALY